MNLRDVFSTSFVQEVEANDQYYSYIKGNRPLEQEQEWIDNGNAFIWARDFAEYGFPVAERRHGYQPWRMGKENIFTFQVRGR